MWASSSHHPRSLHLPKRWRRLRGRGWLGLQPRRLGLDRRFRCHRPEITQEEKRTCCSYFGYAMSTFGMCDEEKVKGKRSCWKGSHLMWLDQMMMMESVCEPQHLERCLPDSPKMTRSLLHQSRNVNTFIFVLVRHRENQEREGWVWSVKVKAKREREKKRQSWPSFLIPTAFMWLTKEHVPQTGSIAKHTHPFPFLFPLNIRHFKLAKKK